MCSYEQRYLNSTIINHRTLILNFARKKNVYVLHVYMSKCYICKRKVPITVETKESFSPNKMCLQCLVRAMNETDNDTDWEEWKKKVRSEQ